MKTVVALRCSEDPSDYIEITREHDSDTVELSTFLVDGESCLILKLEDLKEAVNKL